VARGTLAAITCQRSAENERAGERLGPFSCSKLKGLLSWKIVYHLRNVTRAAKSSLLLLSTFIEEKRVKMVFNTTAKHVVRRVKINEYRIDICNG
jgi:hypothetical protein